MSALSSTYLPLVFLSIKARRGFVAPKQTPSNMVIINEVKVVFRQKVKQISALPYLHKLAHLCSLCLYVNLQNAQALTVAS